MSERTRATDEPQEWTWFEVTCVALLAVLVAGGAVSLWVMVALMFLRQSQ